jgi:zonular occludens toxin Zot
VKVAGGLNFITGPMGSGKSLYGVRRIVEAMLAGKYAVTNVELHDDAIERIVARVSRFHVGNDRRALVRKFSGLYVYETELQRAMRYRVPGTGEGRAICVWDEGHNDLNNRKWKDDGRDGILEWATQLRKLGFVGYLLTQHGDNTDAALRRIANFHVKLQNQREQTRMLGVRVSPWPLFLAAWYPSHLAFGNTRIKPVRVERYFLDWHRHLYDSWGLYHGLASDAEGDVILLPPPARASERASAAAPPAEESTALGLAESPAEAIEAPGGLHAA